jgi:hypothetical protein
MRNNESKTEEGGGVALCCCVHISLLVSLFFITSFDRLNGFIEGI